VRLESLKDHAIRPLHLPICARMSDQHPIDPDPVLVSEIEELFACEVGLVVYDDGIGHTKLIHDIQEKLDDFLGAGLDDQFCLNPLGEFVHRDKKVGETTRGFVERPDHVETPDRELPGEGDGLPGIELALLAHADDLLCIA
jgi:hypothetical protein